jgi:glycosyltransferase involved in cell wall biosynthesis
MLKTVKLFAIAVIAYTLCASADAQQEKQMVIVIPSYNNEQWCVENLDSVCWQEYKNYRIVYIDDCSTDKTYDLVKEYCDTHQLWNKVQLIHNDTRIGALENLHKAIYAVPGQAIVVLVDGDDMLRNNKVLSFLNNVYVNPNIWLTYGQYVEYPSGLRGFCQDFPAKVVKKNKFRQWYGCPISHLRTFYAWLYKKINIVDLMYQGKFYQMTWDKAMMIPMIEMAGDRYRYIPEILYIYNNSNPINDHRVDVKLQANLRTQICNKSPYKRLPKGYRLGN